MSQHIRAKEHEAIALAIKGAKRKLFAKSREGCDLADAVEEFLIDVRNQCSRIVEIGGSAAMLEKDAIRFNALESEIVAASARNAQKGGAK